MVANMIIGTMIASIVGVIAVVIIRAVISGQDTSSWTALESSMVDLVPAAVAIITLLASFMVLTKLR